MNPFLNTAVKAARAAGDVITQSIEHLEKIDIKKNHNNQIVTEVDNAAFQQIKYILRRKLRRKLNKLFTYMDN